MARCKLHKRNIRKITKLAGGSSYGITLPIDMVRELNWKERQKVVVTPRQEDNNRGLGEMISWDTTSENVIVAGSTLHTLTKVESGQHKIDVIQLKEFAKLYKKILIIL